eukprot:TRINITY_DN2823_c0_g1_i1.p1 TRINITY_DN2823_c0_g1~~TRINITY_DN2823_c0_g1_i1.p1  ORF type:complete len:284 (+),score=53.60 TRINITY_DN2823_c0_g1_i1:13-864(+)
MGGEGVSCSLGEDLPVELQDMVVVHLVSPTTTTTTTTTTTQTVGGSDLLCARLVCKRWLAVVSGLYPPGLFFWANWEIKSQEWNEERWKQLNDKERELQSAALHTCPPFENKADYINTYMDSSLRRLYQMPQPVQFVMLRIVSTIIVSRHLGKLKEMIQLIKIRHDSYRDRFGELSGYLLYDFEPHQEPSHALLCNITWLLQTMYYGRLNQLSLLAQLDKPASKYCSPKLQQLSQAERDAGKAELKDLRKNLWNAEWDDVLSLCDPWQQHHNVSLDTPLYYLS